MKKLIALLLILFSLVSSACAEWPMEDSYNWYEVFVWSYQDADGDGVGDLPGLISRLDYIADMGYTGLWLMPIMPSPTYHKYDVTDYMAVDPVYGTVDDFKALVDGAHARGIRVIIDSFIHTAYGQHALIHGELHVVPAVGHAVHAAGVALVGGTRVLRKQLADHLPLVRFDS